MSKQKQQPWMPVFVVVPATKELSVSLHATTYTTPKTGKVYHDYWQRVGTAHRRPDGGFDVHLTAVPVNGRLVIRPPKQNEQVDPTITSE